LHSRDRVVGAEITLKGKDILRVVETGASGTFAFRDLPLETYTVTCRLPQPNLIPAQPLSIEKERAIFGKAY
jgi:hypothetical protein